MVNANGGGAQRPQGINNNNDKKQVEI